MRAREFGVAAVQMVSGSDVAANLAQAGSLVAEAARGGARRHTSVRHQRSAQRWLSAGRMPPVSPAAIIFVYNVSKVLGCFAMASERVDPDSTSVLICSRMALN